jgi:hypothetical protein
MDIASNKHVKEIEQILRRIGERVEGNLVCDIDPWNIIADRTGDKIYNLRALSKGKKKICEIGVNACHSLLIMLMENPTAEYLLFDLNNHRYTEPCVEYIRSVFPDTRIKTVYGNSVETVVKYIEENPGELHTYDLCHIDGGHMEEVFSHDYINIRCLSENNGCVIFDDYDLGEIRRFINSRLAAGDIIRWEDAALKPTSLHYIYKYAVPV